MIEPVYAQVGGRVRRWRHARGLSLAALGGKASLSMQGLSQIEMGRVRVQVHTLIRIAAALEVAVDRLLIERPSRARRHVHRK